MEPSRYLNYLDWIIEKLSSRTIKKLDPVCLVILRMGLYQIFGMSKIPESAACNEAVKMARRFGNRGMAGFVNACYGIVSAAAWNSRFPVLLKMLRFICL